MFGINALNPLMLWGALAVASPIIIHLLNKRRFKIVDWAAMDFLLEADKKNRRRVRLEELIILLLRCLAMLLIALMVARLFLQSNGLGALALQSVNYERIVLLDDSTSMQVQDEGKPTFDATKEGLIQFVRELATGQTGDTFTLLLTSQPDEPVIRSKALNPNTVDQAVQQIEQLEATDLPARLDQGLLAVEKLFEDKQGTPNRIVYVVSDLRHRDWLADQAPASTGGDAAPTAADAARANADQQQTVVGIVKRISEKANGFYIVDVGSDSADNLIVREVRSKEKALVAEVDTRFEVVVANAGTNAARNVEVTFTAANVSEQDNTADKSADKLTGIEQRGHIAAIPPGEQVTVPFEFRFDKPGSFAVTTTIGPDRLRSDNTRYFAAHVREGVPVLLVDGNPSADPQRAETYFLKLALAPGGDVRTGYAVEEVTENQFEAMPLEKYQVIFLCNLFRVTDDRLAALDKWVKAGGGLVIWLGNLVDGENYNQALYNQGKGLLPARLEGVRGDERDESWIGLDVEDANHTVLREFGGVLKPLISSVKVFQWRRAVVDNEALALGQVTVPMRYTDTDSSPAWIEKSYGDGRVVMLTTTCDGDWTDWPSIRSYVPIVLDTARYMARSTVGEGNLSVGTPIEYAMDPAQYTQAKMTPMRTDAESHPLDAEVSPDGKYLIVRYDQTPTDPATRRRGFFKLDLTRHDGEPESLLFAANLDPTEGMLRRADKDELNRLLDGSNVKLLEGKATLADGGTGAKAEIWRHLLLALAAVLCIEQFLAWSFGRRRR